MRHIASPIATGQRHVLSELDDETRRPHPVSRTAHSVCEIAGTPSEAGRTQAPGEHERTAGRPGGMELTATEKNKIAKFDAMAAAHKAGHPAAAASVLAGQEPAFERETVDVLSLIGPHLTEGT